VVAIIIGFFALFPRVRRPVLTALRTAARTLRDVRIRRQTSLDHDNAEAENRGRVSATAALDQERQLPVPQPRWQLTMFADMGGRCGFSLQNLNESSVANAVRVEAPIDTLEFQSAAEWETVRAGSPVTFWARITERQGITAIAVVRWYDERGERQESQVRVPRNL
jgi:hypothetical protein